MAACDAMQPPPVPEKTSLTLEDVEKARQAKRDGEHFKTQKEDTSKFLVPFHHLKRVGVHNPDDEDRFLLGKLHRSQAATTSSTALATKDVEPMCAYSICGCVCSAYRTHFCCRVALLSSAGDGS